MQFFHSLKTIIKTFTYVQLYMFDNNTNHNQSDESLPKKLNWLHSESDENEDEPWIAAIHNKQTIQIIPSKRNKRS